jgi:hypothetical protein
LDVISFHFPEDGPVPANTSVFEVAVLPMPPKTKNVSDEEEKEEVEEEEDKDEDKEVDKEDTEDTEDKEEEDEEEYDAPDCGVAITKRHLPVGRIFAPPSIITWSHANLAGSNSHKSLSHVGGVS